jgi:hypothetical protein
MPFFELSPRQRLSGHRVSWGSDGDEMGSPHQHPQDLGQVMAAAQYLSALGDDRVGALLAGLSGFFSMRYSGTSLVRRNTENTALSDPMSMA